MEIDLNLNKVFSEYYKSLGEKLPNILTGLIVLTFFILLGLGVSWIIRSRASKKGGDNLVQKFGADIVKWGFWSFGIISAMHVMGFGNVITSVLAGAGISAIIIGFAFKDIAENFLAGLLLATNRPFKAGDIIEINGSKGVVKKLNLRTLHLRVSDGRDIFIPNSKVIDSVLTNFTMDGLLRLDFPIGLDTECDIPKARDIILETVLELPVILKDPAPAMVVEEIGESTLNVRVLFWIDQLAPKVTNDSPGQGNTKSMVIQKVRDALIAEGFTFPSLVLEHKIYQEDKPIPIKVLGK